MKKLILISLTIGLICGPVIEGQQQNTFLNGLIRVGTSVTGTCQSGGLYIHRTSGALYYCPSSTHVWTLLGASGEAGISDTFCVDVANEDTCLSRSAAGFLTLSSTTNSSTNTFRIKNGAATEVGAIGWTGNNFVIGTQGGGGTARDTILGSAAGATNGIYLATENTSRWNINSSGHFVPFVNNTYDIGSSSNFARVIYGSDFQTSSNSIVPLSGTTSAIGGSSLLAGACSSGTVSITGARNTMGVIATPTSYPGDGTDWKAYVSADDTVTVKVCALVAVTPSSTTYRVRVIR